MSRSPAKTSRATYRHGDLRHALLDAGIALAREGGPLAVVLREATRRAGVVPNAAYRHFANHAELLQAVRAAALSLVAQSMEAELEAVPAAEGRVTKAAAAARARARVGAVGRGYMRFALREPGLFRIAFLQPLAAETDRNPENAGHSGLNPFELLGAALDGMVEAGVLPPERRPGAEYVAWSAVHGLAILAIDGPLHGMPLARLEALGERVLEMVEVGL
ncbi:TetR/AcrR family transcriptional regulator [Ramlibacter sp.]|uniref:TetR/AcrR family transcriptional regulator n=1 Tax=Ramlibacter sp. TaxID=1917967 RepID=UPI00185A2C96|nr:TetR/AcrR family transcriptional regulator [Ramlibacter sp.]MBA2675578.1 TetR/AcrR family transcriptional regulator [Ramlibacter sp.]